MPQCKFQLLFSELRQWTVRQADDNNDFYVLKIYGTFAWQKEARPVSSAPSFKFIDIPKANREMQ